MIPSHLASKEPRLSGPTHPGNTILASQPAQAVLACIGHSQSHHCPADTAKQTWMTLKRSGSPLTAHDNNTLCHSSLKGKRLRIWIPLPSESSQTLEASPTTEALRFLESDRFSDSSDDEGTNSLFDETEAKGFNDSSEAEQYPASLVLAPSMIEGLYFDPTLLVSEACAVTVVDFCQRTYFQTPGTNQVMLFDRFDPSVANSDCGSSSSNGLPPVLISLLDILAEILRLALPDDTYDLLFPKKPNQARQAIINLYHPGEGITRHVDLLGRYADGIIGVSFGSGCAMRFDHVAPSPPSAIGSEVPIKSTHGPHRHDIYLPERSILVLSKDARYKWTHGIDKKTRDYVGLPHDQRNNPLEGRPQGQWLERTTRLSVTFRWMLAGADVVGETET